MSVMDMYDLKGKIIIVTGGLGLLGRQYVSSLIEVGARVAIFDLLTSREDILYELFPTTPKTSLIAENVDITKVDSWEKGIQKVIQTWGIPKGLINNAALDSPPNAPIEETGPLETYPITSWEKVMDTNLKGSFLGCQLVGREMLKAGEGSIINISSIYGNVSPDQNIYEYRRKKGEIFYKPIAYSVSKSGILNMTRYLAVYWAKKNIRVNTLTLSGVYNNQSPEFVESYTQRIPIGRMAKENEFNAAIVFLLSKASSYMTGSNLIIDGGWLSI
ncbi:MAG: SDR family oxidoreductase [Oligoflexia bacterium]|nr:SDR family oxidoreductase [Oligoflexia bacterium]